MPKKATKNQWRTLRRYALAGDMKKARKLLCAMQEKAPEDAEVAEELRRLDHGEALLITESPKERRKRLSEEAQLELSDTVRRYDDAKKLACLHLSELKELRKKLRQALALLKAEGIYAPTGTGAYKNMLEDELERRQKKHSRLKMRLLLIICSIAALAGITLGALYSRTRSILSQLEEAYTARDWEKVKLLQRNADTGIHRLMSADTELLLNKISAWQTAVKKRSAELDKQLEVYRRRRMISDLSLEERGAFLRKVRSLPDPLPKRLLQQWEELCRPEKEALDKQRAAIVAELKAPHPFPTLSGIVAQDIPLLREARDALQAVTRKFTDAKDTYNLAPLLITVTQSRLGRVEAYLADAEMLQRMQNLLKSALHYTQHLKAMEGLNPKHYEPALAAAKLCKSFPSYEELNLEIRYRNYRIPKKLTKQLSRAIGDKGPTFNVKHPATREQLDLMQDIFTSRLLRRSLYEISNRATAETYYAEQKPSVRDGKAVFTISEFDTQYKTNKSNRIEWDAKVVWVTELDPTPLLRAAPMERSTFFLTSNLADLLGRITHVHDSNCPALAKAYVYHTLLRLMETTSKNDLIYGRSFSKTLDRDINEFRTACNRANITLTVDCWLKRGTEIARANDIFTKWFKEHADRDYSTEMSKTFTDNLRRQPRYIGYVDEAKQLIYREKVAPGKRIWYYSEGKLVSGTSDAELDLPMPYSPLLTD